MTFGSGGGKVRFMTPFLVRGLVSLDVEKSPQAAKTTVVAIARRQSFTYLFAFVVFVVGFGLGTAFLIRGSVVVVVFFGAIGDVLVLGATVVTSGSAPFFVRGATEDGAEGLAT